MTRHSVMRAIGAVLAVTAIAGVLQACDTTPMGKTYPTYRYRLTAEVMTPEGLRTGSSVIEVKTIDGAQWLGTLGGLRSRARGEAVTVDLGKRGALFVLLKAASDGRDWAVGGLSAVTPRDSPQANAMLARRHPHALVDPVFEQHMARLLALRGPHEIQRWFKPRPPYKPGVPVSGYPLIVRFLDVRDPKSVELLNPDHLDAAFGKGVSFRRLVVERTDDPVTTGIEKTLPWVEQPVERSLIPGAGKTYGATDPVIRFGDFIKGGKYG